MGEEKVDHETGGLICYGHMNVKAGASYASYRENVVFQTQTWSFGGTEGPSVDQLRSRLAKQSLFSIAYLSTWVEFSMNILL